MKCIHPELETCPRMVAHSNDGTAYCGFDRCIFEGADAEHVIYARALSRYGAQAQTLMVMEEMSELQKELCKHARGKENRDAIAEEIADVLIMLDQMMVLHDCESLSAEYKREKLGRLERQIDLSEKKPVNK